MYYSDPTWPNHKHIFTGSGFTDCREYRYWDKTEKKLDWSGMMEDLCSAPPKSVIVLHACAHNPTGLDLTKEQWEKVADICQERQLLPFFDSAYQGFASGCPDTDAWAVRWVYWLSVRCLDTDILGCQLSVLTQIPWAVCYVS